MTLNTENTICFCFFSHKFPLNVDATMSYTAGSKGEGEVSQLRIFLICWDWGDFPGVTLKNTIRLFSNSPPPPPPLGFHLVFIRIGSGNFPIWAVDAKMVLVMFPKLEIHYFELNLGSIRDGKGLFHSIVFGILLWVIRRLELTLSSSLYQTHWWNFFPCGKKALPVLHVVAFKPNMQLVVPACEWSYWKIFPTECSCECGGRFILLFLNNSWQTNIICSAVRRLLQIKQTSNWIWIWESL